MSACACKPGRYEEGWQEIRCPECLRAEMDAWSQAIERHATHITEGA